MSTLIVVLCVYGAILGTVVGIMLAVDGNGGGAAGLLLIAAICAVGWYSMAQSDVSRHIVSQDFKERIGVVSEMSGKTIEIDDHDYSRVVEFGDVKFDNIKLGDIVKVKFLDADFGNYIMQITPVTVEAK